MRSFFRRSSVLLAVLLAAVVCDRLPAADLERAHRLYFHGKSAEALEIYRQEAESTKSVGAALNAAAVAQELGHHREAIGLLSSALSSHPDSDAVRLELAWALLNEGRVAEARPLFEAAVKAGSDHPFNRLGLAEAAIAERDWARAEELLRLLLGDFPRLSIAYARLGLVLSERNDAGAAIEMYRGAIKEDSHFVEARFALADLLRRQGEVDEAWGQMVRLSYADPGNRRASAAIAKWRPELTKKPDEIVAPKRIETPTALPSLPADIGESRIRIGIGSSSSGRPTGKKTISLRSGQDFELLDHDGKLLLRGAAGERWEIRVEGRKRPIAKVFRGTETHAASFATSVTFRPSGEQGTFLLNSLAFAPGSPWGGMADKELRGAIEVVLDRRAARLVFINDVRLEEYVYGVLAAEMPVHWPLEALKSQAVIARNIGVFRRDRLRLHRKYGYDVCDEQHCQVYRGVAAESARARQAVDETRRMILTYDGQAAHAVFSSNCGGHGESGEDVGWGRIAYWQSTSDVRPGTAFPSTPYDLKAWLRTTPAVYCAASSNVWYPEYRWTRFVLASDLGAKIRRKKNVGRVKQLYVQRRSPSGRARQVLVRGTNGDVVLKREHEIRKYLGVGLLRSTLFWVETVVRDGKAHGFLFTGGGWGHGVGLCQSGAAGRAESGRTFGEILSHYYPGTTLTTLP